MKYLSALLIAGFTFSLLACAPSDYSPAERCDALQRQMVLTANNNQYGQGVLQRQQQGLQAQYAGLNCAQLQKNSGV